MGPVNAAADRSPREQTAPGHDGEAAVERPLDELRGTVGSGAVVVVPVKAFSHAKMRLAPVLGPEQRAALARKMAEHVVAAAAPLPVVVVCDDEEVAAWAQSQGARPLPEPGLGLNGAMNAAATQLWAEGYLRLVAAHADLPLASDLPRLAQVQGIALVPDRTEEGTNVISLPAGCGFRFAYGPGSFLRHKQEALRTGLPWRVIHDPGLAWDVDFPSDMAAVTP
jgi:2-phospho-L-lactate guanylyltransferase